MAGSRLTVVGRWNKPAPGRTALLRETHISSGTATQETDIHLLSLRVWARLYNGGFLGSNNPLLIV